MSRQHFLKSIDAWVLKDKKNPENWYLLGEIRLKCPAVKCVCGHMSQNLEVVKSPWSNVPWSNETVVIGDPIP